MRRKHPGFFALFALALASGPLLAADLRDMKLLQDESGTRAVLDIQGASSYKLFSLHNPDRLVLDLESVRAASGFRLPAPNGAVANVRTGQPVAGTLRIVFDLGAAVATTSHLERDGATTRLIVELAPSSTAPGLARAPASPPAIAAFASAVPPAEALAPGPMAPSQPQSTSASAFESAPPPLAQREYPQPRTLQSDPAPAPETMPTAIPDSAAEQLFARAAASRAEQQVYARAAATSAPAPAPSRPSPRGRHAPAVATGSQGWASPAAQPTRKPGRTLQDVIGPGQRKLVVAIDAGHGGKDPGAHGPSGVREKMVTLEVARELARQVNADPGMRAVLIRDNDRFVPLKDRYMIARRAQADLFISIHADASPNDSASGASVFVLSTRGASSQAARWLANQENAADLVGGVSLDTKDFNLASVLLDLSQSATMRASDDIANQVLDSLKNVGKAHKASIERANFVVLRSPDVPSMLIETGFITNPSEEQRLNDPGYRGRLASAITDGVRRYFLDQAPPGSWYASRQGGAVPIGDSLGIPQMVASPR